MSKLSDLLEASVHHVQRQAGAEVKMLKTTFNDPHVKAIIAHVTGGDPALEQKVRNEVESRLKEMKCVADASPILYEAGVDNVIETVLFDWFWEKPPSLKFVHATKGELKRVHRKPEDPPEKDEPDDNDPAISVVADDGKRRAPEVATASRFNVRTFNELISKIRAESRSFFPLRNMVDYHVIHHPAFTPIGDGVNPKIDARFKSVTTAAATADGTFVFNVKFCQALLDFAHLKGLKAPTNRYGKKYVSQGGKIPDDWLYIEFLIRHEIMHYTYSDFHYEKVIPDSNPKIINWVGDFRSNHKLLEQGFPQLPMGLFSSYVNFHKQGSYKEMYKLVKNEFDKLKDECKQHLEKTLDGLTDNHEHGDENTDGTPKQVDRKMKPEDIENGHKKVDDKVKNDEDIPPDYENKPPEKREVTDQKGGNHELNYSQITPKYKWDALLRKMVTELTFTVDQTYQKISRRAIGTMQQVITRGHGAVKPGDIKNPSKKKIKLAVVVDSSGSMSYVIQTVMANLDKLLIQRQGITGVSDEFYLFIFSGDYDIYKCTPGKGGMAENIPEVDSTKPGPLGKVKLSHVLSHHKAGGTVFSSKLAGEIKKLAGRGYNCLIVSDGDMLSGENFTNFKQLYESHRKNVWLLLDSRPTFESFIKKLKEISNNASHM